MRRLIAFIVTQVVKNYYYLKFSALFLLGRALKGKKFLAIKERSKPKCLEGWDSRYVQLQNVRLHYVQTGSDDKPLMLFIHGYPEFWYAWRFQLNEFKDRYRCVAIDQRGFNLSDKPEETKSYTMDELVGDVRGVITELGYEKAIVVAHDWGGLVAWEFAERYPEMVEKLICCNIPRPGAFAKSIWGSWSQFRKSWYIFFYQNQTLPEILTAAGDMMIFSRFFRDKTGGIQNRGNFTDEDLEAWKYSYSYNGASFKYPLNYYRNIFSHVHVYRKDLILDMPVLIIWGTADAALDYATAEDSLKNLRNGIMKPIPGASHFVQQDEPELVNQYISEFLTNTPAFNFKL
uniref:AB hydrolase-1 domain-containing protein n=1 Tax=Caenorhabditis japonica TaxID=281687 RepID=A0A8R1HJR7_CAEJA